MQRHVAAKQRPPRSWETIEAMVIMEQQSAGREPGAERGTDHEPSSGDDRARRTRGDRLAEEGLPEPRVGEVE